MDKEQAEDKSQLLEYLATDSSREVADMATAFIGNNENRFEDVLHFATTHPYPINMRAARVAEFSTRINPEFARKRLPFIVNHLSTTTNDGVKRGFLKIVEAFVPHHVDDDVLGLVIDICFNKIITPGEAIAVKWYSIQILQKIVKAIPELEQEFIATLDDQQDKNTANINRMVKQILDQHASGKKRKSKRP